MCVCGGDVGGGAGLRGMMSSYDEEEAKEEGGHRHT